MLYLRFIILKRGRQPISRGGEIRFCYMKNWCPSAKEIRTCYEALPKHCRRIRRVNYAFTTTWHPINYAETFWHGVCKKTVWRKSFELYGWKCFYKRLKQNELVVFNPPRSHGEHRALLLRLFSDESTKVADAPRSTQRAIRNKA